MIYAPRLLMLTALCWVAPVSAQEPIQIATSADCEDVRAGVDDRAGTIRPARERLASESIAQTGAQFLP